MQSKQDIYTSISASATLRDGAYWLEIILSAGIATLGLITNSPAVIIGAMLISPLMGPIMANGLAIAAGDLILAIRACRSLLISAVVAIAFATLLVVLLPFRVMTAEIAARTQPNTLDLVIALFAGAVGSIAVCKRVRGVATSIPGVAIAVALMPPLCVVGYGIGIAATVDSRQGAAIARGGGLLFLTNLVAITFTATIVFVAFHIDSADVRTLAHEWRRKDRDSARLERWLKLIPIPLRLQSVGGLPARLLLIAAFVIIIFVPLSRSFESMKQELAQRQFESAICRRATQLWEKSYAKGPPGAVRSYVDSLSAARDGERVTLHLRIFTRRPYDDREQLRFVQELAALLHRTPQTIDFSLVQIPTSRYAVATRHAGGEAAPAPPPPAPPSTADLLRSVGIRIAPTLLAVHLPPPAVVDRLAVCIGADGSSSLELRYASPRAIDGDGEALLTAELRRSLKGAVARISLRQVPTVLTVVFARRDSVLPSSALPELLSVAGLLARHPAWTSTVTLSPTSRLRAKRSAAVIAALVGGGTAPQRISDRQATLPSRDSAMVTVVTGPSP